MVSFRPTPFLTAVFGFLAVLFLVANPGTSRAQTIEEGDDVQNGQSQQAGEAAQAGQADQEAQAGHAPEDTGTSSAADAAPGMHGHGGPHAMPNMKRILRRLAGVEDRTDHQKVIGRWGIEVRRWATMFKSQNSPDPRCPTNEPCIDINSIGVRRWVRDHYAWNAALALGVGGGKTTPVPGDVGGSWDTYLAIGPMVGANFLLAQTQHIAVSAAPEIDFLAFLPSSSGTETIMLNVRALIEAEIHLGFIDLPSLSVGTSAGLLFNYTKKTTPDPEPNADTQGGIAGPAFSAWDLGFTGPQTLWGLVNEVFFRFYF